MLKRLALSLFLLSITIPTFAQNEKETANSEDIFELEEVVVTATRTQESILDVPQHVTVISEEDINDLGAADIAEVLTRHTGVSVSDYGPQGALQSLSIRGSTGAQVLVLIDGVRAPGSHGGADFSMIPLDNIERIEIVRGGTSALYGADAVGGVVNIITKKEADNKLKIILENGSYIPKEHVTGFSTNKTESDADWLDLLDTQKASVQYSRKLKGLHLTTSGSFIRADNGFIFKDTNNENRKRENADLIGGNISAGIFRPMAHGGLDFKLFGFYNEKGIPGAETSPSLEAEQKDQRFQSSVHYYTDRFFNDLLTFDVNTHFDYSDFKYKNPSFSVDSDHKTYSTSLEMLQEMFFFNIFSLIYGGSIGYEKIDSTELGNNKRVYGGGFIEVPVYLTGRFTLLPVLRYDYYSDFKGDVNFKLGVVYTLSNILSLKGSISKSYRAPTFNDLYWPQDAFAEGNPDLNPETGYSFDIGVTRVNENLQYNIFGFLRYIQDVILWQPGDDDIWRPSNWGEAVYPGIETNLTVHFLDSFTVNMGYTFLYTFVLSGDFKLKDNRRLPMIPVHKADVGFEYRKEKDLFNISSGYESIRYIKTSNAAYLPSQYTVNAHYKRTITDSFSLLISVDNLFNEDYEIETGYPMPGTFIRTGLEATF